ncbi:MAG: NnrU family protein [Bacteroidetes bacterium]|nr:NnrU family protein [Bacteroidota bacterium]
MMKFLILIALWTAFCFLHSFMITPFFTELIKRKLGERYRYYRLFYNIFSILILIPVVVYSSYIMEKPFFTWRGYLLPVRYLLLLCGLWIFHAGSRHYNMRTFLGINQLHAGVNHGLINDTGKIEKGGIMGIVRHPFYSGSFLLIWASNLDATRLISNTVLSLYLVVGTMLEEQKLIAEFGDVYRSYQKEVSMLFPCKYIKRKFKSLLDYFSTTTD